MKPNYAKRRMREVNNTQYRPEQFRLQTFFKIYCPAIHTQMEYPINIVIPDEYNLLRIADFVDLDNKIAYFLNGEIHSPKKDEETKLFIETYTEWKVENIDKDSVEWNWLWKR